MNVGTIKSRVQRAFGDESSTFIEATDVLNWLNDGQMEIVRKTNCLQAETNGTTVVGTNKLLLTTIAPGLLAVQKFMINYIQLKYSDISGPNLSSSDAPLNVETGSYFIWNGYIYWNMLDAGTAYNYRIYYLKSPTALAVDADIPEIPVEFHEDLVIWCLIKANEMTEDYDAADRYRTQFRERVANSRGDTNLKQRTSYTGPRLLDTWD